MTEETPEIAPQKEFKSLGDFIRNSNNFYMHFMNDCTFGQLKRKKPAFTRFQEAHSDLERETTAITILDVRDKDLNKYHGPITKKETWEKLLEAYSLMSQLVYTTDPYVIRVETKKPDEWFLCR